jgi:hypothetical protein
MCETLRLLFRINKILGDIKEKNTWYTRMPQLFLDRVIRRKASHRRKYSGVGGCSKPSNADCS